MKKKAPGGFLFEVPKNQLARLIEKETEHTRLVNESAVVYPDPDDFDLLSDSTIRSLGFSGRSEGDSRILEARARKHRKGGRKPVKKSLPSPQTVLEIVEQGMEGVGEAPDRGNRRQIAWNMEFLTESKARYFLKSYMTIIGSSHLLYASEVTAEGLKVIADALGYGHCCCRANNRSQAVGFIYHPRLVLLKEPISYDEIAWVQGIPDLRPAFRIDYLDTWTGKQHWAVVVHLKSMRGGPKTTSAVRYQQCQLLKEALAGDLNGSIGGDFNTFLGESFDTSPLEDSLDLILPEDRTPTQIGNSRLDGFYGAGNCLPLGRYHVRNFWRHPLIKRDLSDHGIVFAEHRVCQPDQGSDPTCGDSPDLAGGPFSSSPSQPVEIDIT